MGISFHRDPAGEPGRGLIYQGLGVIDKTGVSLCMGPIGEPEEGGGSIHQEL